MRWNNLRRLTILPDNLKDKFRKQYDNLRNIYELKNNGQFDLIYPLIESTNSSLE
jgi:hypothetical protein